MFYRIKTNLITDIFSTYFIYSFGQFNILFLPHFLLLQKCWELDKVILDENIFLSEFSLLQFEFFLLPMIMQNIELVNR